jgi:hypothetical protein
MCVRWFLEYFLDGNVEVKLNTSGCRLRLFDARVDVDKERSR